MLVVPNFHDLFLQTHRKGDAWHAVVDHCADRALAALRNLRACLVRDRVRILLLCGTLLLQHLIVLVDHLLDATEVDLHRGHGRGGDVVRLLFFFQPSPTCAGRKATSRRGRSTCLPFLSPTGRQSLDAFHLRLREDKLNTHHLGAVRQHSANDALHHTSGPHPITLQSSSRRDYWSADSELAAELMVLGRSHVRPARGSSHRVGSPTQATDTDLHFPLLQSCSTVAKLTNGCCEGVRPASGAFLGSGGTGSRLI
mmetsp:Transcript_45235/g.79007  ORF Transcript_45235/g.79007 Transcript_45235/m.79007 type:complete len:255 (+) Transcript_45235:492-1256(+)